MSSQRSRGRAGGAGGGGIGEEAEIWAQDLPVLSELANNERKVKDLVQKAIEMEAKLQAEKQAGKSEDNTLSIYGLFLTALAEASMEELDTLGALYREQVKLTESSQALLAESEIITKVEILKTVVKHNYEEPFEGTASRSSNARHSRSTMEFDGPSDSPVPSPAENKHIRKHAGPGRTSSQPPSIKDEKEDREPSNPSRTKIVFALGAEVAFKPKVQGQAEEHDWIQGIVVKVIGEGKSRRYDVQDPFPADDTKPGETYRSSASSMVTIPPVGIPLPDYEVGKRVLALYPDTTTFYRAEVKATLVSYPWFPLSYAAREIQTPSKVEY